MEEYLKANASDHFPITQRHYRTIIQLAIARARIELREQVKEEDVMVTITTQIKGEDKKRREDTYHNIISC